MYQFHDDEREISFQDYKEPTPWMNYLSNGTFHAMISQAAGGVAFYRSPQIWRLNHYRFYNLPMDRSGFYVYIKNGTEVWAPSNEPCPVKPERWEGRHGLDYTEFHAFKKGITVDVRYYIALQDNVMIWELNVQSIADQVIQIYPYVELGMMEYLREVQWQCYNKHQLSCYRKNDFLIYRYGVEEQPRPEETPLVFFASDVKADSFDCDRDAFIGSYRSEENPQGIENEQLSDSELYGGDPCFALKIPVLLRAGERKRLHIFLGTGKTEEDIAQTLSRCRSTGYADSEFNKIRQRWENQLSVFQCRIPDSDAQRMINIWNPYQVERNFEFSRNISYYATGTFRGVGLRDTAQDIIAMASLDWNRSYEKFKILLTQQYKDGHCNHYFFPIEGWKPVTTVHSDDHLWLIFDAYQLAMESGKIDFLNDKIPYFDGNETAVWEHLKQAIAFTASHIGDHGFPLMLRSDWNDMLYKVCRKGKGESIWTAMQFGVALNMMTELAEIIGENTSVYRSLYQKQKQLVNNLGWDGRWFRRCITDDGRIIGSDAEPQAKIWLNTQTWSVLSGMGDPEKQQQAMNSVGKFLDTRLGIRKIYPAMKDYPSKEDPLTYYNKGCGENGSIFCHANTWAIIAECMLGRAEKAWKYYSQLLPMRAQMEAGMERYRAEPYVYASNIFGPESNRFGLANVSWLTGTAAWMYLAVTQYMLGIRPTWQGLEVKPCLDKSMLPAHICRKFRGELYDIEIRSNTDVRVRVLEK